MNHVEGIHGIQTATASAPAFSPADIAGLQIWLDAALGITLTSGKVSAWADQSGIGNHFGQSVAANRPSVVDSAINGLPAVRLVLNPGVGNVWLFRDGIDIASLFGTPSTSPTITIFTVMRKAATSDIAWYIDGASGQRLDQLPVWAGDVQIWDGGHPTNSRQQVAITANDSYRIWTNRRNGATMRARVDKATLGTDKTNATGTITSSTANSFLFGYPVAATAPMYIAEWLLYAAALTDPQVDQVEGYLGTKYGI